MSTKLGKRPIPDELRDAVHIAIAPIVAPCDVMPGAHVDAEGWPVDKTKKPTVGIVDPFLPLDWVHKGETFWLCLYPETVTGLNHVWTHPAFPVPDLNAQMQKANSETDKGYAKSFLTNLAVACGLGYDELVEKLKEYQATPADGKWKEDIWIRNSTPDFDTNRMWWAFEVITGVHVLDRDVQPFSCSC